MGRDSVGMWMFHCLQKGHTRQGKGQGDVSGSASVKEIKSLARTCGYALCWIPVEIRQDRGPGMELS